VSLAGGVSSDPRTLTLTSHALLHEEAATSAMAVGHPELPGCFIDTTHSLRASDRIIKGTTIDGGSELSRTGELLPL